MVAIGSRAGHGCGDQTSVAFPCPPAAGRRVVIPHPGPAKAILDGLYGRQGLAAAAPGATDPASTIPAAPHRSKSHIDYAHIDYAHIDYAHIDYAHIDYAHDCGRSRRRVART
jgi:hypothetical protein